jgi:hypothetical protein
MIYSGMDIQIVPKMTMYLEDSFIVLIYMLYKDSSHTYPMKEVVFSEAYTDK